MTIFNPFTGKLQPTRPSSVDFFNQGDSLGSGNKIDFTGPGVNSTLIDDKLIVNITADAEASSNILYNYACDESVYIGAAVRLQSGIAVNSIADSFSNSNVIGFVESKPTLTTCNIRIDGITEAIFSGLDETEEYYLSDTVSGGIVPYGLRPIIPGTILVKLGQPYTASRLLYKRGTRELNQSAAFIVNGFIDGGVFGSDLALDVGLRSNDTSVIDQGSRVV